MIVERYSGSVDEVEAVLNEVVQADDTEEIKATRSVSGYRLPLGTGLGIKLCQHQGLRWWLADVQH